MNRASVMSGLSAALCLVATCGSAAGQDSAADKAPAKVSVGKPAPDFKMTGIDGKEFSLSEVTASGKNVVLLFDRAHW